MFSLSGSPSRESWLHSQPHSYLLPIGRSHCVPKLCLNRLQYHLPLSLNDHPCLQCPGLAPALAGPTEAKPLIWEMSMWLLLKN